MRLPFTTSVIYVDISLTVSVVTVVPLGATKYHGFVESHTYWIGGLFPAVRNLLKLDLVPIHRTQRLTMASIVKIVSTSSRALPDGK